MEASIVHLSSESVKSSNDINEINTSVTSNIEDPRTSNGLGESHESASTHPTEPDIREESVPEETNSVVDKSDIPEQTAITAKEQHNELTLPMESTTSAPVETDSLQNKSVELPPGSSDDTNKISVEGDTSVAAEVLVTTEDESGGQTTDEQTVNTVGSLQFETVVMIEQDNNVTQSYDHDATNNILSQLDGGNIDLGEALRTSQNVSNSENNNGLMKQQEVLNKEELLDILEGNNDSEGILHEVSDEKFNEHADSLESALALHQFHQLKVKRKTRRQSHKTHPNAIVTPVTPRKKRSKKPKLAEVEAEVEVPVIEIPVIEAPEIEVPIVEVPVVKNTGLELPEITSKSIVNVLVKDWDDDEEDDDTKDDEHKPDINEQLQAKVSHVMVKDETLDQSSLDSTQSDSQLDGQSDGSRNMDESNIHRRAGRVIKKKVIFDPDNPDTFTKPKNSAKIKESSTENKVQSPPKKPKIRHNQSPQIPKSKSPVNETLWKKPHLKNKNQNRRLTEVDKLLMDEGAVNMIYQLTPEASKGRQNMRKKAELIKKINQSATPDSNEKKFRERRKETRSSAEPEPKKILGHKQRISLNSSVKSPSVSEDFEAHSADDSIIYRRHSSSSYSSTCMSPRRLSDVDANSTPRANQTANNLEESAEQSTEIFMAGESTPVTNEIIDKNVCLSIKEKLNSKLSRALNMKRKRDGKGEKPPKQRKSSKPAVPDDDKEAIPKYEKLRLTIIDTVAEIHIQETGSPNNAYNVKTLKELQQALLYINNMKSVSVTLLTSVCGSLCSGLDLHDLVKDSLEVRRESAFLIADSVRLLLQSLNEHTTMLVAGVDSTCGGLAMAILSLCDYTIASNRSTFKLIKGVTAPVSPGVSVLMTSKHALPRTVVQDMLVSGRVLSSGEATQQGLVTRTLATPSFLTHVRAAARDIASDHTQTVLLKKNLLRIGRSETFLNSLVNERDLLVEYWCSAEGLEALRRHNAVA